MTVMLNITEKAYEYIQDCIRAYLIHYPNNTGEIHDEMIDVLELNNGI